MNLKVTMIKDRKFQCQIEEQCFNPDQCRKPDKDQCGQEQEEDRGFVQGGDVCIDKDHGQAGLVSQEPFG